MRSSLLALAACGAVTFALPACSGAGGSSPALAPNAGPAGASTNRALDAQRPVFDTVPGSDDAVDVRTHVIGIRLVGETMFMSPVYGTVLGYFKGKTSTTSQVVTLGANETVVFKNVDPNLPHTASFLGDATKTGAPFPKSFDGSSTASTAGTTIGTAKWSTGALNPGSTSLKYNTGAPGFYMIGCAFHYNSSGMRTVVIVK